MGFYILSAIKIAPGSLESVVRYSSAFFVLAGLLLVTYLLRKALHLMLPNIDRHTDKTDFEVYGFIISFTLWWLILDLPEFEMQSSIVRAMWTVILFFAAYLIFDVAHHAILGVYSISSRQIRVPQIIINLVKGVYFLLVALVILRIQHKLDIRPFLTGSAILTAIIGLALQDTLGNLFSGLALHISRPFNIGHWIRFGTMEGAVVKIDWRATTIKTREEDFITIPNSQMAKGEVINYSTPTTVHGQSLSLGVRYEYPPNRIKKLLTDAAMMTEGVIEELSPTVFLESYSDFSIDYRMRFFVDDYLRAPQIKSALMERIWYVFNRNDVEIPFPIRDVYLREDKRDAQTYDELVMLLSQIDFLQNLTMEELSDLAKRLKLTLFSKGERIITQGEMGDTFYIIKSGVVRVSAANLYGEIFLDKEMKTGSFFGEISVLTGEPRSATISAVTDAELMVLDKSDFEMLLKKFPDIDKRMSQQIAARQKFSFEQMELAKKTAISEKEAQEKAERQVESLSYQLLNRIRNFFSIS